MVREQIRFLEVWVLGPQLSGELSALPSLFRLSAAQFAFRLERTFPLLPNRPLAGRRVP